jgi:hypothetical protein
MLVEKSVKASLERVLEEVSGFYMIGILPQGQKILVAIWGARGLEHVRPESHSKALALEHVWQPTLEQGEFQVRIVLELWLRAQHCPLNFSRP